MPVPFDELDIENKNKIISNPSKKVTTFKIEPNYNIYLKDYERKVSDSAIDEKDIPNSHMYSFLIESLFDKDTKNKDEEYLTQLSLGEPPKELERTILKKKYSFSQYLEKFYTGIGTSQISKESKHYKKYCVSQDDIVEYNKASENHKKMVNYCLYLEFPFDLPKMPKDLRDSRGNALFGGSKETNFKEIFKKTNTDLNLVSFVSKEGLEGVSFPSYYTHKGYNVGYNTQRQNWSPSIGVKQTWDVTKFFKDFAATSGSALYNIFQDSESKIFLGETNEALQKYKNTPIYEFFQKLMNKVAEFQFKKLVKSNSVNAKRYFDDMWETPHEVLFYSIEKVGPNGILTTHYLSNPTEKEKFDRGLLKFVDTQIKYGIDYIYNVSAYCLVLGKKYKYEYPSKAMNSLYDHIKYLEKMISDKKERFPEWKDDPDVLEDLKKQKTNAETQLKALAYSELKNKGEAVKIRTEDYIPLIKIPLFSTSKKVLDHPPVPPRVTFSPLKDKNNELKIRLVSENTEYWQVPISITAKDDEEFDKLKQSHPPDEDGRILFATDDYAKEFEIFRTDTKPRSYRDFAGKKIKTYSLGNNIVSVSHKDKIKPNKKYYYTFRAIDQHNHTSNPTLVYEVTLRDDSGYIYPIIKISEFEEGDFYKFSSEMQTYIQIKPSPENTFFNTDLIKGKSSAKELNLDSNSAQHPLGISSDPAWGKKFKLRITSKTSGKKVDVNFTFNKRHKKIKK
jgi:hypothetical protein